MAIDHEYTQEIVCPSCGHKKSNSGEYGSGCNDSGEEICGSCGVEFIWDRITTVEYCTEIKK
jgi:transcription elongation factor Elf1